MKLAASKVDFFVEGEGVTVVFGVPDVKIVVTAVTVETLGEGLAVGLIGDGLAVGSTKQLLVLLTTVQLGAVSFPEQMPLS